MLTILAPALLALAPQQPTETATRLFPTQQFAPNERERTPPQWGTLLQRNYDHREQVVHGTETWINSDFVQGVVETLEQEAIETEQLIVWQADSNLVAFGDARIVQRVDEHLAKLLEVVGRDIRIECSVWEVPEAELPETVLDERAFAAFASQRTPVWRSVATTRSNRPVTLDHMTWTRYVRGVHAEVAQKSHVYHPLPDEFGTGGIAVAAAHALIEDDGFALHLQFSTGDQREPPRPVQTGVSQAPNVQVPVVDSCFGTCSGRVANGGALAVMMRGQPNTGGNLVLTVRAKAAEQPSPRYLQNSMALPISAMTTESLTQSPHLRLPDSEWEPLHTDFEQAPAFGRLSTDTLRNLVESLLEQHSDGEQRIAIANGFLFVHATPAVLPKIQALLKSLQERLVQNADVRHTASTHLTPTASGEANGPILHELRAPTLIGRQLTLVRARETNQIVDLEAHIAQEANLLTPRMQLLQAGTWLRAYVVPTAGGRHLDMQILTGIAPSSMAENVMPTGGAMMLGEVSSTFHDHQGAVPENRRLQHGSGPRVTIGNRTYRTRLSTRVR